MKLARSHSSNGQASRSMSTLILTALAAAILLSGCGGGGGADTKTGSGGTGDPNAPADALIASGPLSSVGVSAIGATGLDDRAATIFINTQGGQSFNALKLGMVAEVTGTIPATSTSTTAGTATNLNVQSAVSGSVTRVDVANQRFSIGFDPGVGFVTVQIDQNTIFEGLNSLANLTGADRVEVYGIAQPGSNSILATRLIVLPATTGKPVEFLGVATNVAAFQFALPGVTVSTAGVTSVTTPTGSVPGTSSIVESTRVRVGGTLTGIGNRTGDIIQYTIDANKLVAGIPIVRNDNSIIVLDGIVQSLGANGRFRLNDTDVETSAANAALATVGSRVQVKGRKTAGVLAATDFRRIAAGERIQYIVQGDIANFVSPANFTVRGESINASTAAYVGGTAASLANGRSVRVKAQAIAGHLEAIEVSFATQ
ncbi:MAG: DUF5666 domain-containing protein [Usitatibacteraceae bacterium]